MRQRKLKNEINVVPYIDVMLVLLVIFMVATPMMTTGSVNLPESGSAPGKPDKYLKVEVQEDGRLSIYDTTGKEIKVSGLSEMRNKLDDLKGNEEKLPAVLVAGDGDAPYKKVIEVLDEVKKLHFDKVGLETRSK